MRDDKETADAAAAPPAPPLAPGLKRGNRGTTYKLVQSGAFEIADHTSDRVRQLPVPQAIIATVTLPANAVCMYYKGCFIVLGTDGIVCIMVLCRLLCFLFFRCDAGPGW